MSERREPLREPLHQPPNPADLRRAPPKTPGCAQVRSWLRDFADHDLESAHCRELEEHVHQCRLCAVELARAEHEVLQLRRAYAGMRREMAVLPEDFAARVVDRLVVDETSLAGGDLLGASVAERKAMDGADAVAPADRGATGPRRLRLSPGGWLIATFGLVLLLAATIQLFDSANRAPERVARLVVQDASNAFYRGRLLGPGEFGGLGERQSLRVGPGGGARVAWHDLSPQPQPAATLQLLGKGEVRLEDGAPLVASGRVGIDANRPVSIGMADGSRIDLGVGEYVIAAELMVDFGDSALAAGTDPLRWAAADLEVTVEVIDGAPATVVRSKTGDTLISTGQVGVYRGSGPLSLGSAGGLAGAVTTEGATRVAPGVDNSPSIAGHAMNSIGLPSVGAEVWLSFRGANGPLNGGGVTSANGGFVIDTPSACASDFAVVLALPPSARSELGIFAPDAVQLLRQGGDAQLIAPLVFGLSTPFVGEVRDDFNQTRAGVRIVPLLVDELFGHVLPLGDPTVTAADGSFRLDRLPARLPAHQHLVVLISHDALEPVAIPIPTRGSAAANEQFGPLQVRRLRQVRLHQLPQYANVQIFEEIAGLPPGTGVWKRFATSNWFGHVAAMSAGWGRMWLRAGPTNNPMVRELVLDGEVAGLQLFSPEAPKPYAEAFHSLQPLPDSHAEVAGSYRHERFVAGSPQNGMPQQMLRVLDSIDRPVVGAQVFAVQHTGPRNSAVVKFIGFTSPVGVAPLYAVANTGDVVVIGGDGTVIAVPNPQSMPMTVNAALPATASVLLGEALRPSPARAVTIRFEKLGGPPGVAPPVAVRFACEATNWVVSDLPPGEYRAVVTGQAFAANIELPSGANVVLP